MHASLSHTMESDNFQKMGRLAVVGTCAVLSGGLVWNGLNTLFNGKKTQAIPKWPKSKSCRTRPIPKADMPYPIIKNVRTALPNKTGVFQGSILCTLGALGLWGSWYASRHI